jgi:esterase/lipase
MIEFISNIIDDIGINVSRFLNSGKVKLGKDIKKIEENLKEYDTKRIFERIITSTPIEYKPIIDIFSFNPLNNLETSKFSCESAYEPFEPFKDTYRTFKELHTIKGEVIKNKSKKHNRAIIVLHNYFERNFDLYKMFVFPNLVLKYGYDVYAVELPHHMERQTKGSPFSGAYFLSGDPVITIEAFRQAVSEVTQIASSIKEKYDFIDIVGINLGGHIAMFSTVIEDAFDKYIFIQTGANLNEYVGKMGLSTYFEECSLTNNIKEEYDFVNMYRSLNLDKYKPIIDSRKVIITAGRYDKIVPFWSVKNLEKTFNNAKTIYYDGGNFSLTFIYKVIMDQSLSSSLERR